MSIEEDQYELDLAGLELSAEQILKTPEYLALEHKLGDVTLSNISNLVQSALNKAGIDSEHWDADSDEDKQKYKNSCFHKKGQRLQ